MQLQERLNRKTLDGKIFNKFEITLPRETVEALGWKKGDKLEYSTDRHKLIIIKTKK